MTVIVDTNLKQFIECILAEDLASAGDITSKAIFEASYMADACIRSKGTGVLSGIELVKPLIHTLDSTVEVNELLGEGNLVHPGTEICRLSGSIRPILAGERSILNLLQRLSGIATQTAKFVAAVAGTRATIIDTRKTTPLMRSFEKKAVVAGGGSNHRFGLYDMMLIKDTHVRAAGGVQNALKRTLPDARKKGVAVEIEVQSIDEFQDALRGAPDRIMLDNMNTGDMRACVAERNARNPGIELEASGNVSLETVRGIAETGVDFISVGSLTHSVQALDIHLVII